MAPEDKRGPSTRCVHGAPTGVDDEDAVAPSPNNPGKPSAPGIHPASVYRFPDLASTDKALANPGSRLVYSRYGHPTGEYVEGRLAALEDAESAVLFSSGTAAMVACVLSVCGSGDRVVASSSLYGGTTSFLQELRDRHGLDVAFASIDELYRSSALEGAELVVVESPANPLTRLVDFERLMAALPQPKPVTVLDATFATPLSQRAMASGFDLVAHSATKYLGGHDDLLAGVVCGGADRLNPVREWRRRFGAACDPQTAWLLDRGLKTLALRWERQCQNAAAVAEFLNKHDAVRRVWYPGLESHPDHELARRQMHGFGAVVAFEVDGLEAARAVYDALQVIQRAPTLGGVESTVLHPVTASHRDVDPAARETLGIFSGTLRLSLGIEDAHDLIDDLRAALSVL